LLDHRDDAAVALNGCDTESRLVVALSQTGQDFVTGGKDGAVWYVRQRVLMVGKRACAFAAHTASGANIARLAELFVAPGQQGLGIVNELLDHTMQHAKQTGATEMGDDTH